LTSRRAPIAPQDVGLVLRQQACPGAAARGSRRPGATGQRRASCSSTRAPRDFYRDWNRAARDVVGVLRSAAGRNPYDRELSDLVGELSMRSETFRTYWASHNVRFHVSGTKQFHHLGVGDISLNCERLEVAADSGLAIVTDTAADSKSQQALKLLGSWAATPHQTDARSGR
jgi:hypothetical protein